MGSGSILSLGLDIPLEVFKALDICLVVEMRVDGGDERGQELE